MKHTMKHIPSVLVIKQQMLITDDSVADNVIMQCNEVIIRSVFALAIVDSHSYGTFTKNAFT